ncbi:MAG: excinuclease ABC subunit UvrC [Candidatus Tectimicrobiota bacterium]
MNLSETEQGTSPLEVRQQIERFPRAPGVYLMKDTGGKIVYVGKAKNLYNRVRQYFSQSGDPRYHIRLGLPSVVDIDFLVTDTEKDALILENTLIKKHKPRFNINLRDDKNHVHLRLDPRQDYPRLTVVRRPGKDKALYFGPYASSHAVRETLRLLYRAFPIRSCTDAVFHSRTRPCLYHEIGQCAAPCVPGYTTKASYDALVQQVVLHLQGRSDELIKSLKAGIAQASDELRFEEAALLYKRLQAVQETVGKQHMTALKQRDEDIFGYYRAGDTVQIQTLNVRNGQLVGGRAYTFPRQLGPEVEILSSFINQYYAENPYIPREILLPCELDDALSLAELLSEKKGRQVSVLVPQKGDKHHLVQLAMKNAALSYQKERDVEEQQQRALEELQQKLQLQKLPSRIECFDISNISGTLAVGSMVCFQDGQPNKQRYRRYRIQTLSGPNDYGMMLEVLRRRYRRALAENDLPDLLMVDGGKGQLNMALKALHELGITDLEVVGIAKSRLKVDADTGTRRHSDEKFYRPQRKNAVIFPVNSSALFLLQRVRDEAHRFAVTYHKSLRQRQQLRSSLENVPGVGGQRKTQLLRHFGSLKQVREASREALQEVLPVAVAQAVYDYFHAAEVPAALEPLDEPEEALELEEQLEGID